MKKLCYIALLLLGLKAYGSHIVGGEMIYDYLGNDQYRITLKIYRDCSSSVPFDGTNAGGVYVPARITVIQTSNNNSQLHDIGEPVITKIPPTINNPCIKTPGSVCVEEGIYTYTLTLPPVTGGYYIVYQRCCRNNTIINLLVSGNQGSTYYTKIPGPEDAVGNSSPRFNKFPPIFLCNKLNFTFDHAATDPDGDRLVYSLCAPYQGIDACCSYVGSGSVPGASSGCPSPPAICPPVAPPPPYSPVDFVAPYTGSYPIASNPSISIDPATGQLTGQPNLIGQFVVAVCIEEYRGDVLIGTHFRDFQFNIVGCVISVVSAVADQKKQCVGSTISFTNMSSSNVSSLTYAWDFGDPNTTTDTSSLVNPSYTYRDTGRYVMTLIANPGKQCSDTLRKDVYVYPPLSISYVAPPRQCFSHNAFDFDAQGLFQPQAKFEWNFTADATPGTSTLQSPAGVSFGQPGLFFVKLLALQFACRDSAQDTIRVLRPPLAKINNLPMAACDPARVAFSNGSSADLPLQYAWSFSNGGASTAFEPLVVFSPGGVYQASLMVITQGICTDTSYASINTITVNPLPVGDFLCTPQTASIFEPEITITDKSSYDASSWYYDFDDGQVSLAPATVHFYKGYGNFMVTQIVMNQYGCSDTTRHLVSVLPEYRFWVPNTFSPDGNALNDVFMPIVIGVIDYRFEIFDRWGEKVFETEELNQGWNGQVKGQAGKQDVYVWRASFKNIVDSKKETHTGHVLVLRNE